MPQQQDQFGLPAMMGLTRPMYQPPPLESMILPSPAVGVGYVVSRFLGGIASAKAEQAMRKELEKANQYNLLASTLQQVAAAPLVPEEKQRLMTDIHSALARLVLQETGGRGRGAARGGHPVANLFRGLASRFVSAMAPEAPKTMKPEEMLNLLGRVSASIADPTKNISWVASDLQSKITERLNYWASQIASGRYPTREDVFADLQPYLSRMAQLGLQIPDYINELLKTFPPSAELARKAAERGVLIQPQPGVGAATAGLPMTEPPPATTPPSPAVPAGQVTPEMPAAARMQAQPEPPTEMYATTALLAGLEAPRTQEAPPPSGMPPSARMQAPPEQAAAQIPVAPEAGAVQREVVPMAAAGPRNVWEAYAMAHTELQPVHARVRTETGEWRPETIYWSKSQNRWLRSTPQGLVPLAADEFVEAKAAMRTVNVAMRDGSIKAMSYDPNTGMLFYLGTYTPVPATEVSGVFLMGTSAPPMRVMSDSQGRAIAIQQRFVEGKFAPTTTPLGFRTKSPADIAVSGPAAKLIDEFTKQRNAIIQRYSSFYDRVSREVYNDERMAALMEMIGARNEAEKREIARKAQERIKQRIEDATRDAKLRMDAELRRLVADTLLKAKTRGVTLPPEWIERMKLYREDISVTIPGLPVMDEETQKFAQEVESLPEE